MPSVHEDYEAPPFDAPDRNPFEQFRLWFADAQLAELPEPEAMVLSTAPAHARVVLMRMESMNGFRFYTNYDSAKARQIAADPAVALTFFWSPLHRSVRIEGIARKAPAKESDAYFASRPRGSQIGAHASPQSEVIADRAELDARVAAIEARFPGTVPRPENWGGFIVRPDLFEFWQGQPSRLHDRWRYWRSGDGWQVDRLGP